MTDEPMALLEQKLVKEYDNSVLVEMATDVAFFNEVATASGLNIPNPYDPPKHGKRRNRPAE